MANCNTCKRFAKNLPDREYIVLRIQYGIPQNFCLSGKNYTRKEYIIGKHSIKKGTCGRYDEI